MTDDDIDKLSEREMDAAVAREVMKWHQWTDLADDYDGPFPMFALWDDKWVSVYEDEQSGDVTRYFSPSTKIADAFEMEAEIERKGHAAMVDYIEALRATACRDAHCSYERNFALAHAGPPNRCRAALRAVNAQEGR